MANPEIVAEGDRMLLTVSEAAQMLETDCETVLLWLRTGAPYSKVGDWRDGTGFVVDLSWLVNWLLLVGAHLTLMGNRDLQDALRLPG